MEGQMQQSGKGMVRRLAVVLGSAALLLPLAEPVGQHAGTVARHLLAVAAMVVATPAQAQDSTPPRVISIERRTPATSPTNANTLTWRVTFSEFVATPGTTDFMVSGSTAEVTNVTKLGGFSTNTTDPTSYSVTVSGGNLATFNGTVTLGFATSQAIIDFWGNRLTDTTPTVTNESNYVVDNTAPSVTYTAPTSLTVGMAIMLTPSTTDSDASSHSYSATGLPAGLEIDASAGVISGAPTAVSTATSEVVVTVTDSVGNSATVSFIFPAVEVPPNTAPTVANEIEDQTATVGTAFSFQFPAATFEDVDGDMLTYTATLDDDTTLPSWLRFDTANRSFSGTPGAGDGGTLTVRVTASDDTDSVHDDFEIKVATVCAAPNFGTRRQIWTGTVTVGTWGNGVVVFSHGYLDTSIISDPNDIGALDDNDFAIAGRTYIINRVNVWRSDGPPAEGDLRFSLTSSLMDREKAALRLHVCDTAYDFDDASNSSSRPNDYDWSLELDWSGESTRTLHLSLPENNAATGLPTITSSDGATVGDVLTANQVTIADTDGLPASFPNDYTFQWVREDEDGMNPEDITGETSSTYTLRTDDVGKKVRVRVSFTDQLSGMEMVTSDAFPTSDTVAAPDTTPPQVTLITRSDSGTSPTNEDSLTWRVHFSEAVNNVDTGTFMVSSTPPMATPPTVTSVEAVVGETGVYDVTVSGGDLATFDGTVILALASGSDPPDLINPLTPIQPGITDEAGNPLDRNILPGTSESYVVDHTAPMVTAITRQTPTTSPTNANSLTWRVTFSEVVTNVDGGDFTVGSTPPMATPPTVSNVEAVSGETGVHDVTVSGGDLATFDGTVTLDFASGQDIQDHAGNPLATTTLTGNYVVDNTAPTLTYTAPMFLIVGTAITPVEPSTTDTDIASTSATDLPAGLMIDASTGVISGTPDTANASPSEVVMTVTDNTGNSATVALTFPAVVQPGVSVAPPRLSPVEGETATYTLVLDTLPAGPVTITPTRSGDSGGVSVSLASVTFTAANWNTAQVVSVTAMDDDNTASETVTISHSISGYGAVTSGDAVVVTVTDDDTPGVSVQRPVVSTDEGETATYTVRLVTQPAGPVTISPTSGDSGAVSLTPARLTFTVANWNTPRTVSVTGVQDDDASNETVTVSHSVSGYGAITTAPAVMVTVTDGDTAQVSVSPVSVNTDEGGTATYTLALDTLPNGPVTITPTNGDSGAVSVSPARLTFTPSNWDMPRTISVTGLQDDDANDETVSISHNVSGYGGVSVGAGVTVSVTDDDTAGVRVTPISLSADEGGTVTYTLQLSTQPAGPVTITPTSGDSGAVSLSPATLTITPSTWDTPRSVAVTAGQDDDGTDETVSVGHRVSGYGAVTSADAVTVTVTDDDTAGVRVTPTSLSFNEGGTVTYTLQLSTEPAGPVTITPTNGDSGAVSVEPARLTFTPSTWDTPRTVTVTGLQDDDANDETVSISHNVSGYGGVSVGAVVTISVTDDNDPGMAVTDHDTAGVRITSPNLNLDEGGTTTYTLQLSTQPAGAVTITPTSGDSGAVSLSPATLIFTPSTWDTPRSVAVTAGQDDDGTDETVSVGHRVSGYGAVTSADAVTVTVTDDDTAGVRVTPTSLSADEGGTATYTLQLSTQPAGAVTITPTSGDSGAVSVSPATLTITPSTWDTPRSVAVTAGQDDDANDETVSISHNVSGYGGVSVGAVVTISVTDDNDPGMAVTDHDTAGVRITPPNLNLDEGGTTTYTLQLSTQPAGAVTITPTSGDSGAVSVSPATLTLTPSTWDTPRTVAVTAGQDDDGTDETVSVGHRVSGYGAVTSADAVTVTVTDDDTAGVRVTPTSLSFSEGGTVTYTLQLSTQPAGPVTITPTSGDSGAVSLSPATLTLTPSTWDTPRSVAVTAGQDDDGTDETVSVGHRVSGYGAVTSADAVTVTVTDNTADTTAPMVTAIERQTPATSPTNADSLTWRVTFSKAVTNVDAAAFTVSGTTATVTSVQAVHGETLAHDVTVSGGDLADLNGTVTLSFAPGQDIADAAGNGLTDTTPTGTNHNSYLVDNTSMETTEPLAAAWLARMGRTVAQQVMDAVAKRGQDDPAPGLQLSVAGESLNTELELSSLAHNHDLLAKALGFEDLTSQQLAEGTGFALSPAGAAGGFSLWGEAALSGFATTAHDLSLDADVFTTLLGGDWRSGQWQVGAALAHSTGSGTYHASHGAAQGAGDVSSRVTGLYPYAHYAVTPQFSLWGVVGHGTGEWTLTPDGGRQQDMPLTLSLAAVGMEGLLQDGGTQGFTLKGNADALWMGGSADAAADGELGEDGLDVDTVAAEVSRLRLGLQASRTFPMGDHAVITPSLEAGLRQDGGDADTGFGLDMGAGLLWQHHRHGLSAQLQGRRLLVHMAEDVSDQGLSLALSWDPTPDSTLGPSFSLEQTLGGPATAQVETLLGGSATAASTTTNGGRGNAMDNQRLELRWGYGLAAFRDAFSLTPHLAVGFSPTGRDTTLGWTLAPLGHNSAARSSTVSLEVTRREPTAHHNAAVLHHSLGLQLDSRF